MIKCRSPRSLVFGIRNSPISSPVVVFAAESTDITGLQYISKLSAAEQPTPFGGVVFPKMQGWR